jgi:hypothetical protein
VATALKAAGPVVYAVHSAVSAMQHSGFTNIVQHLNPASAKVPHVTLLRDVQRMQHSIKEGARSCRQRDSTRPRQQHLIFLWLIVIGCPLLFSPCDLAVLWGVPADAGHC